MEVNQQFVHGSCVAIDGYGVLVMGASGSGKSDLCLRLIDRGAVLVADDQTRLTLSGVGLTACAPASIAGRIEVRGLGIVEVPFMSNVPLRLVIELGEPVERMPLEPAFRIFAGVTLPLIRLEAFEASAPVKVALALKAILGAELA